MGNNQPTYLQINYEDMLYSINNKFVIINTLKKNEQSCLINNTVSPDKEIEIINNIITNNLDKNIIIYGKNCSDQMIYKKYIQLKKLNCKKVFIYPGGLFEWLCLQDIYGKENFPTTSQELDILKYKPKSFFHQTKLLENSSF